MIQIPLFPLHTVLFPDGVIALKIFEVRYLDLMKKCYRDQSQFGIVGIEKGLEIDSAPSGAETLLSQIGTMAQIIEFESLQSALYFTRSIGKSRFNLLQSKQLENGLWVGDVEILNADVSIPIPAELEVMSTLLKDIISSLERQQSPGQMLPFSHPYNFNDCGWVANRLAELMPLSIAQKNHLLSQVNPRIRLDLVKEILEEINQNPGMHKPQKSI